jgi:hypothetical protein
MTLVATATALPSYGRVLRVLLGADTRRILGRRPPFPREEPQVRSPRLERDPGRSHRPEGPNGRGDGWWVLPSGLVVGCRDGVDPMEGQGCEMRAAKVAAKVMVAVLAVLVVNGCALVASPPDDADRAGQEESSETSEPTPTSDTARAQVDPEAFPLAFSSDDKTVFPEKPVYDGELVGTRLITMTLDQLRARTLPELDTSWQMAPVGLFVDVETQDEQLYVLDLRVVEGEGTRAGRFAMTLSRISPATGAVLDEVLWEKTQDVQASGDPVVKIAAILGDVVIVESSGGDEGSRRTLTAVDLAAGEELWTRRPGSFVAADDDVVVLTTATSTEAGSLVAVDAITGRARWSGNRPRLILRSCPCPSTTVPSLRAPAPDSPTGPATRPRTKPSSSARCRGSGPSGSTSRPASSSGSCPRPVATGCG